MSSIPAFVTERDVHHDFFTHTSCPPRIPDESVNQSDGDHSSTHGRNARRLAKSFREHYRFASALVRNQVAIKQ